jgi:hypothetical protein
MLKYPVLPPRLFNRDLHRQSSRRAHAFIRLCTTFWGERFWENLEPQWQVERRWGSSLHSE